MGNKQMMELLKNPVFLILFIIRFLIPFLIFKRTKLLIILSLIVDGIDGDLLYTYTNLSRQYYQIYDKLMDSWFLFFILIYILVNEIPYKKLFLSLFVYRLIGVLLMTFWFHEWFLILFPNVFEPFFEVFIFFPKWFEIEVWRINKPYFILLITFIFVIFRELWLHRWEIDMFDMKGYVENGWKDYWSFWFVR